MFSNSFELSVFISCKLSLPEGQSYCFAQSNIYLILADFYINLLKSYSSFCSFQQFSITFLKNYFFDLCSSTSNSKQIFQISSKYRFLDSLFLFLLTPLDMFLYVVYLDLDLANILSVILSFDFNPCLLTFCFTEFLVSRLSQFKTLFLEVSSSTYQVFAFEKELERTRFSKVVQIIFVFEPFQFIYIQRQNIVPQFIWSEDNTVNKSQMLYLLLIKQKQALQQFMNNLPLYSKKKNSQPMKTEAGSSQKKYFMLKQLSNSKNPLGVRDTSPIPSQIVKAIPSNIIYDKQTLYMEVQELKKIINNLVNQNVKLKTRLTIFQTEKERLNKSRQKEQNEQRYFYRPYLPSSPSQIKSQTIKNEGLKKQVKQLTIQLEVHKKENTRIKRSMKYSKVNELQLQLKTIIEENKNLFSMNQQMRIKIQGGKTTQYELLESMFNKKCNENNLYLTQIENLNVQIMNLQSQLRIERAQRISQEKSLKNDCSEEKRITAVKLKQIIDFRRQNTSLIDSKIRSFRAKEKLQQTSFKSHHVHVQPIRKNHIFNGMAMQKRDSNRGNSIQIQQRINQDLLNENQRLKQELNVTQHKLKEAQQKVKAQITNHIQSKPSGVPTFFSQNTDKEDTIKQKLIERASGKINKHKTEPNQEVNKSQKSENRKAKLQKRQVKTQQQFLTPIKVPPTLLKSQSQRDYNKQSTVSIQSTSKIKTQYLKQTVNIDVLNQKKQSKQLLKEIRQLLGYRFSYQKYRFVDLKKDIESSNTKELSFVDICHMFVNQPFYLNHQYCRTLALFIFENQRPKHQEKVETAELLIKLRKIIKDYQEITPERQFQILQNCIQLIKKNAKHLIIHFQQTKNTDNTIPADKLKEILQKYSFKSQEIEYIITQVSINAVDLYHVPFDLILQRFSLSQSSRSSKREIIFQEQKSNINSSQNSVLKRTFQNIDSLQPVANHQNQNIQKQVLQEQNLNLKDQVEENKAPQS